MSPSDYRGFSLVELLVTVVIVAVIAVFATPQFEKHRIRRANMQASADLKALQATVIRFHNENGVYPGNVGPATGEVKLTASGSGAIVFETSRNVYIAVNGGADGATFTAAAKNTEGNVIYHVDSVNPVQTSNDGTKGVPLQVSDIGAPPASPRVERASPPESDAGLSGTTEPSSNTVNLPEDNESVPVSDAAPAPDNATGNSGN